MHTSHQSNVRTYLWVAQYSCHSSKIQKGELVVEQVGMVEEIFEGRAFAVNFVVKDKWKTQEWAVH